MPRLVPLLQADPAGYHWFLQDAVPSWFAQDVPRQEDRLLATTQDPIRASAFDEKVSQAAWLTRPSWYLTIDADKTIYPAPQTTMDRRIGARIMHMRSSNAAFFSKPRDTAAAILDAVGRPFSLAGFFP